MAYVFDDTKIAAGNPARVSFTNSNVHDIVGNVAGTFRTDLIVVYKQSGNREIFLVEAEDVANGALGFKWTDSDGVDREYPADDLLYDDGSGNSGGGVSTHNLLTGRSAANAHPIGAVTGLQNALDDMTTAIASVQSGAMPGDQPTGGGAVNSVTGEVPGLVDNSDPENPVILAQSVSAGARRIVDLTPQIDGVTQVFDINATPWVGMDLYFNGQWQIPIINYVVDYDAQTLTTLFDEPPLINSTLVVTLGTDETIQPVYGVVNPVEYTIPQRTDIGNIKTNTPVDLNDAVNKQAMTNYAYNKSEIDDLLTDVWGAEY